MGPRTIAQRALELGLELIGLTDHNSARNTPALESICQQLGLGFIPGLEVTTREEAHCLALFPDSATALAFGEEIAAHQPRLPNRPQLTGDQIVVDAEEYMVEEYPWWLHAPTDLAWEELGELIHAYQGLWIPAHIDRAHGGVIQQLGFLPQADYDAVEVVAADYNGPSWGKKLVRHSDAHAPEHIGRRFWELPEGQGRPWDRVRDYLKQGL